MSTTYLRTAALAIAGLMFAAPSFADHDRRDHGRNDRGPQPVVRGQVVGRAVPRVYTQRYVAPHYIRPRVVTVAPYRPYYYTYRPGFSFSFAYGSPYYGYPAYSPYAYPTPPAGYISPIPGRAYGGVRIEDAPQDGQVFADGYYINIVKTGNGRFVEVQGTAEAMPFGRDALIALLDLADLGIRQLVDKQRAIVSHLVKQTF